MLPTLHFKINRQFYIFEGRDNQQYLSHSNFLRTLLTNGYMCVRAS